MSSAETKPMVSTLYSSQPVLRAALIAAGNEAMAARLDPMRGDGGVAYAVAIRRINDITLQFASIGLCRHPSESGKFTTRALS